MSHLRSIFYFLAICIAAVVIMTYAKIVLIPLSFGVFLAILFHPVVEWLKKYVKYHGIAYLTTVLIFLITLIIPSYFIISTLVNIFSNGEKKSQNVQESISEFTENIQENILGTFLDADQIQTLISQAYGYIQDMIGYFIMDSVNAIANIILSLLFSFFLHAYFSETSRLIIKKSDIAAKKRMKNLIVRVPDVVRSYLLGVVFVMGIIAVFTSLLLMAVGLEYALVWGIIVGIFTIIPYVGSALGITLPLFYSLIQHQSLCELLIIVIGYLVIQFIEGNFVTPKVVGDKVGVNPFVIIIGMMIMGKIWGIAGVMITIPLMAMLKIILEEYGYEFITKILLDPKDSF